MEVQEAESLDLGLNVSSRARMSSAAEWGAQRQGRRRAWSEMRGNPDARVTQISGRRENSVARNTCRYFNSSGEPVAGDKTQRCPFHSLHPHSPFHKTQGWFFVFFFAFFHFFLIQTWIFGCVLPTENNNNNNRRENPKE